MESIPLQALPPLDTAAAIAPSPAQIARSFENKMHAAGRRVIPPRTPQPCGPADTESRKLVDFRVRQDLGEDPDVVMFEKYLSGYLPRTDELMYEVQYETLEEQFAANSKHIKHSVNFPQFMCMMSDGHVYDLDKLVRARTQVQEDKRLAVRGESQMSTGHLDHSTTVYQYWCVVWQPLTVPMLMYAGRRMHRSMSGVSWAKAAALSGFTDTFSLRTIYVPVAIVLTSRYASTELLLEGALKGLVSTWARNSLSMLEEAHHAALYPDAPLPDGTTYLSMTGSVEGALPSMQLFSADEGPYRWLVGLPVKRAFATFGAALLGPVGGSPPRMPAPGQSLALPACPLETFGGIRSTSGFEWQERLERIHRMPATTSIKDRALRIHNGLRCLVEDLAPIELGETLGDLTSYPLLGSDLHHPEAYEQAKSYAAGAVLRAIDSAADLMKLTAAALTGKTTCIQLASNIPLGYEPKNILAPTALLCNVNMLLAVLVSPLPLTLQVPATFARPGKVAAIQPANKQKGRPLTTICYPEADFTPTIYLSGALPADGKAIHYPDKGVVVVFAQHQEAPTGQLEMSLSFHVSADLEASLKLPGEEEVLPVLQRALEAYKEAYQANAVMHTQQALVNNVFKIIRKLVRCIVAQTIVAAMGAEGLELLEEPEHAPRLIPEPRKGWLAAEVPEQLAMSSNGPFWKEFWYSPSLAEHLETHARRYLNTMGRPTLISNDFDMVDTLVTLMKVNVSPYKTWFPFVALAEHLTLHPEDAGTDQITNVAYRQGVKLDARSLHMKALAAVPSLAIIVDAKSSKAFPKFPFELSASLAYLSQHLFPRSNEYFPVPVPKDSSMSELFWNGTDFALAAFLADPSNPAARDALARWMRLTSDTDVGSDLEVTLHDGTLVRYEDIVRGSTFIVV